MRIEYETTIDEMATTNLLWLKDTGTFEKWIAWGVFYWLLVIAIIIYFAEGSLFGKFMGGAAIGGLLSYRMIFDHKTLIHKKLKKALIKKLGSNEAIPASLEITAQELIYRTEDSTVSFMLKTLKKVEDIEGGILASFQSVTGNCFYPVTCF
jgi:hypothetical protein